MKHAPEKFGEKLRLSLDEKVSIEKIVIELPSGWNKLDNEEVGWVFGGKIPSETHGPNQAQKNLEISAEKFNPNSK